MSLPEWRGACRERESSGCSPTAGNTGGYLLQAPCCYLVGQLPIGKGGSAPGNQIPALPLSMAVLGEERRFILPTAITGTETDFLICSADWRRKPGGAPGERKCTGRRRRPPRRRHCVDAGLFNHARHEARFIDRSTAGDLFFSAHPEQERKSRTQPLADPADDREGNLILLSRLPPNSSIRLFE